MADGSEGAAIIRAWMSCHLNMSFARGPATCRERVIWNSWAVPASLAVRLSGGLPAVSAETMVVNPGNLPTRGTCSNAASVVLAGACDDVARQLTLQLGELSQAPRKRSVRMRVSGCVWSSSSSTSTKNRRLRPRGTRIQIDQLFWSSLAAGVTIRSRNR
jgi:hypothetical protein